MSADTLLRFRAALTPLHPRGRKWLRFLERLDLDPDELPRPIPSPGTRDFIICGAPRSGTTLLSALLLQPPKIVTVVEPWLGMRLPPRELFLSLRQEIARTKTLPSGKLDVEALQQTGDVKRQQDGPSAAEISLDADYLMGIKWPEYWRYVGLLPDTKFLVCVRHPVEVIRSFKRIGGRLGLGLGYDIVFNRRLNRELLSATSNLALRRILLYERINAHLIPHLGSENVLQVRYERWFEEPEVQMADIGLFLGIELGPMPARIRRNPAGQGLDDAEARLIAEHCKTAAPLGYSL
jgi:hypothetical protein